MTIDRTTIKSNAIPTFDSLSIGDVFLDLEDDLICIKTEPGCYVNGTHSFEPDFNAVDLSDGEHLLFDDLDPIQLLKAELTVRPCLA